jgi:hypothetical protein
LFQFRSISPITACRQELLRNLFQNSNISLWPQFMIQAREGKQKTNNQTMTFARSFYIFVVGTNLILSQGLGDLRYGTNGASTSPSTEAIK